MIFVFFDIANVTYFSLCFMCKNTWDCLQRKIVSNEHKDNFIFPFLIYIPLRSFVFLVLVRAWSTELNRTSERRCLFFLLVYRRKGFKVLPLSIMLAKIFLKVHFIWLRKFPCSYFVDSLLSWMCWTFSKIFLHLLRWWWVYCFILLVW